MKMVMCLFYMVGLVGCCNDSSDTPPQSAAPQEKIEKKINVSGYLSPKPRNGLLLSDDDPVLNIPKNASFDETLKETHKKKYDGEEDYKKHSNAKEYSTREENINPSSLEEKKWMF